MTETCQECGEELSPRLRRGTRFCSRACQHRQYQRTRARSNPDANYARVRRWRAQNPEKKRAQNRKAYRLAVYGQAYLHIKDMTKDRFRVARAQGYRSGLEVAAANQLTEAGVEFQYESLRIPFQVEETRHYVPDFILSNGIILELKGRWLTPDRKKHRLIASQYPDLDVRFVFSRPQERISKQSRTTYARFCETQGWKYGGPLVPVEWLRERVNVRSLRAIERLLAG